MAQSIATRVDDEMWIIALEGLVALLLLVLIVWLTMGGSRRHDDDNSGQGQRDADSDTTK